MGLDEALAALEAEKQRAGDGALKDTIRHLQDRLDAAQRQIVELSAALPSRRALEPRTHLVIGDPHSDPKWPNDRFTWLGRAIADLNPDVVVCMGDFATLGSLGKYDRGKLSGEGQRLTDDIAACRDALARINAECRGHPAPKWMLAGNHEDRVQRYTNDRPELAGTYSIDSLGFGEFGWQTAPFLSEVKLDGISYVHFVATVVGHAVASKHLAHNILSREMESVVVGHSHRFSYHAEQGARKFGLSAGCFFDFDEPYATPNTNADWARGLCLIRDVMDGWGSVEFIPMETIKRDYA